MDQSVKIGEMSILEIDILELEMARNGPEIGGDLVEYWIQNWLFSNRWRLVHFLNWKLAGHWPKSDWGKLVKKKKPNLAGN